MANEDFEYKAGLDDSAVLKALKRIAQTATATAKNAGASFARLKDDLGNVAIGAGGVVASLTGAALAVKEFTDAALELSTTEVNLAISAGAANREFGAGVGTAASWGETVKDLSAELKIFSEQELNQAASRLVDMSKRLGLTEQQMVEVLRRTADLSAGKTDLVGALERTTSALRGEAESAEYLGLSLNENAVKAYAESQGLVWSALSDTEKAGQRYNLFLDQTAQLSGKAALYAQTLAGQEAALNAQLENQKAIIGEQLLPLRAGYVALLGDLSGSTEESFSFIQKAQAGLVAGFIAAGATIKTVIDAQIEKIKAFGGIVGAVFNAIKTGQNPLDAIQAQLAQAGNAFGKETNALATYLSTLKESYRQTLEGFRTAQDQAKAAAEQIGGITPPVIPIEFKVDDDEVQKALDKISELERDAGREALDIQIDAERKQLDALADFAQKRVDLATKNVEKLKDIERDLSQDLRDAETDYNRNLLKVDQDRADKQLDIEKNYQRRLQDIKQNFSFSLEEAARNRDSVTYQRLLRQRGQEIQQAQVDRSRETEDASIEAARRREELRRALQYEQDDARQAFADRLEDQRIAQDRELESLRLAEAQKNQELVADYNRRLEDSKRHNADKLADLIASLSAEVQAFLEAEERKTQILRDAIAKRNELQKRIDEIKDREAGEGHTSRLGGRQFGGPVGAGQTVMVGERGPEPFRPSIAGNILPPSPSIMSPLLGSSASIQNVSNFSPVVNQSMLADQSAMMRAIAENSAINVIKRLYTGAL